MKAFFVTLLALAPASDLAAQKSVFADIEQMSASLEEITGLHFNKKVPASLINKEQLRKFLNERIDQTMKPDDIRAEELTLKMMGLIPRDFDLRSETVDLLTEQAAAFYDYHKKKLFILEGETGTGERIALVHELAHALADQNFHLDKYVREDPESDDSATARMAVMEGQATWLMTAYMQGSMGGKAEVSSSILELMSKTVEAGASQFNVFSKAPLYIRESLVFPYTGGMAFQDAVFRKLGKQGFAEVFERAPVSTQQIFHPGKYLDREEPRLPPPPRIEDEKKFRKLSEGTLGEFDFRIMLAETAGRESAREVAAHILGSRYVLFENKSQRYPVLAITSVWDSPEQARAFYDGYRKLMEKKAKTFNTDAPGDGVQTGQDDDGYFRMSLSGERVESVQGLKTPSR